jgi:hypothetical protein
MIKSKLTKIFFAFGVLFLAPPFLLLKISQIANVNSNDCASWKCVKLQLFGMEISSWICVVIGIFFFTAGALALVIKAKLARWIKAVLLTVAIIVMVNILINIYEVSKIVNDTEGLPTISNTRGIITSGGAEFSFHISVKNATGDDVEVYFDNEKGRPSYRAIIMSLRNEEDITVSYPTIYGASTVYGDLFVRLQVRSSDRKYVVLNGNPNTLSFDKKLNAPVYYLPELKISNVKLTAKSKETLNISDLNAIPSTITWEQAVSLISNCKVKSFIKGHTADGVSLTNGRNITISGAPSFVEMADTVSNVGGHCLFRIGRGYE